MKQAIAGVSPEKAGEVTIMIVYPTLAATGLGRFLGRRYASNIGFGGIFTLGTIWIALTIPIALGLFFAMLGPGLARRYRLTNRRLVVDEGMAQKPSKWVTLDDFDAIDIEVLPGQAWYPAGDMIFRKGKMETFRLSGVSRPESFKHVCLKAQQAHTMVASALKLQPAAVG
jgi:hypothetical protein